MEATSFTADKALAESLARLAAVEDDNQHLKCKLQQLAKKDARTMERVEGGGGSREMEKLHKQNKEVGQYYSLLGHTVLGYESRQVSVPALEALTFQDFHGVSGSSLCQPHIVRVKRLAGCSWADLTPLLGCQSWRMS